MIIDALLAVVIILSVVFQSGKGGGLAGALGGGSEGLFTGKVRSNEAILARITMVAGILFAITNLMLAKFTS